MAKGKPGSSTARLARWRSWVQAAFLLAWLDPVALLSPLFGARGSLRLHMICSPVFHCHSCPLATFACPIGILAHLNALNVVPHALNVVPYMAIGTLVLFGAIFGSFICGWACPFGFLQDLIAKIPTPKFALPGWMGYTRYAVLLVLVLAIPLLYGKETPLFFCSLCPAAALEVSLPHGVWPNTAKATIFLLIMVAMFFTWRPWCTLFCPLGAIYSLCNRVSLLFLRFHPDRCKDCDLCRDLCRYRGRSERRANDLRCVRCLDCTRCRAISVATALSRPKSSQGGS